MTAALAAQRGFTSDLALAEGAFLSGIYGVKPDLAAFTDALGEGTVLAEVSFKPWCAARQTMAATQALREIIESGVAPAAMDEIRVSVLPPHLKMIDHGVVDGDRASYLTSLPYCMAAAAIAPETAFEVQQAPPQLPAAVRAFMEKIKLQADEGLLSNYPRTWQARVSVLAGTAQHAHTVTARARRSRPALRPRAGTGQVHAFRRAAARDRESGARPGALHRRPDDRFIRGFGDGDREHLR